MQSRAGNLGRVDDAGLEHINEVARVGVEADGAALRLDFLGDHAAVISGVGRDVPDRLLERSQHNRHAELLVAVDRSEQLLDRRDHPDEGHAAARDNPFLGRGPRGVQSIFNPGLGLLHVGLGRRRHTDQGHAARQLGQPLLELLLVVFAFRFLDLAAKLINTTLDVGPLAGTLDDRRAVFIDLDLLGLAKLVELKVLQLESQVFADHSAACQRPPCHRAWPCGGRRSRGP